jgi:hypothetical protein
MTSDAEVGDGGVGGAGGRMLEALKIMIRAVVKHERKDLSRDQFQTKKPGDTRMSG